MTQSKQPQGAQLGSYSPLINSTLNELASSNLISRIWEKDASVWQGEAEDITGRLGWLNAANYMGENILALNDFAKKVKLLGLKNIVLIGMGGSSLGPYVISKIIPSLSKGQSFNVLDSTAPDAIKRTLDDIEIAHSLFLVSSKSGDTSESMALYKFFWEKTCDAVGFENAGQHFVAITDQGTPLARLAIDRKFLRLFENDANIGGRFSVTSYFGFVPAVLTGLNCNELHARIAHMSKRCEPSVGIRNNPGGWLGAALAALYSEGRDKITLIASDSVAPFPLWIEQLLAESIGKSNKGVIPVVDEPLLEPNIYGDDRVFVYIRMHGDDNAVKDVAIERINGYGHPVITIQLEDNYDIGAEFFRWQMATAVLGHMLGVNPFDQPDVQSAKDATVNEILKLGSEITKPIYDKPSDLASLLEDTRAGNYFSILAYVSETEGVKTSLQILRERIAINKKLTTTLAYGPRYLHSTGQLHKGGPNSGVFLLLVSDPIDALPIPTEDYGFHDLLLAQMRGDLSALQKLERKVVCINLGSDPEAGVLRLLASNLF